ncbi:MAG TPA: hypothetical protein VHM25_12845, partial [Polyangiaceae bacterium]|nr:hypothetical protein [Polyangiaceae bacterium]
LPSPKEREELLRLWIDRLPEHPLPYPWPFSETQAIRLCQRPGVTPRMLLVECRRAFQGEPIELEDEPPLQTPPQPVEAPGLENQGLDAEWEERISAARAAAEQASERREAIDASRLADGLLACGPFLKGSEFAAFKSTDGVQLKLTKGTRSVRLAFLHQAHPKSLGSAIAKLTAIAAREPVVVLRERAHDLLPTWKDTLAKRSALLATNRARWIWFEREDAERLLALDSLLQAARSGDLTDERGAPIDAVAVGDWIAAKLDIPKWTIVRDVLDESDKNEVEVEVAPKHASPEPTTKTALALVRRLRIASLDRVVREVTRLDPLATRASVLAELESSSGEVRWFGRSIVGVRAL